MKKKVSTKYGFIQRGTELIGPERHSVNENFAKKYIHTKTSNTDSLGIKKTKLLIISLILFRERQGEVLMWNNLTFEK